MPAEQTSKAKNYFLGTLSGYIYYGVSIIIGFISVPISVKYFGLAQFGILAIIATLTTYLSASNFGIPTAVGVLAAKALNRHEQIKIILKGFMLVLVFSLTATALFYLFRHSLLWGQLLGNVPASFAMDAGQAVFFSLIFFVVGMPLSLFMQGFLAAQKVHIGRTYDLITLIMGFVALLLTIYLRGTIVYYVISKGILSLIISLIGAIHYLFFVDENRDILLYRYKEICSPAKGSEFSSRSIMLTGFRFFLIGIAATVVWNTDNLVISHFIGLEAVSAYAITFRLVTITFALFTTLNAALAPMYGRAYAEHDYPWINQTYNTVTAIEQLLAGFLWLAAIAFSKDIIQVWVGGSGFAGLLTVFAIGGYGYLLSLVHSHASLMSSANILKNGVVIGWSEAGANLLFSLVFVRMLGVGGVALGTCLASLLTVSWMIPAEISKRSKGKINFNIMMAVDRFIFILAPCLFLTLINYFFVPFFVLRFALTIIILSFYVLCSYKYLPVEGKQMFYKYYNMMIGKLMSVIVGFNKIIKRRLVKETVGEL